MLNSTFDLISDPTRRRILDELRISERSVNELVTTLKISQPAVSKQLRSLREAGLVNVRVEAQRRFYSLNPMGLKEIEEWLAPFRILWEERLDALERTLDSMED